MSETGSVHFRTMPFRYLVFILVILYVIGALVEISTKKPLHDLWQSTEVYFLDTTKAKFSEQKEALGKPLDINFQIYFHDGQYANFGYDLKVTGKDAQKLLAHGVDADLLDGKLHTCDAHQRTYNLLDGSTKRDPRSPPYLLHIPAWGWNVGPESWDYIGIGMLELITKNEFDHTQPSAKPDGKVICGNVGLIVNGMDSSRLVLVTGKNRDVLIRLNRNRKNTWPAEIAQSKRWSADRIDELDSTNHLKML